MAYDYKLMLQKSDNIWGIRVNLKGIFKIKRT